MDRSAPETVLKGTALEKLAGFYGAHFPFLSRKVGMLEQVLSDQWDSLYHSEQECNGYTKEVLK